MIRKDTEQRRVTYGDIAKNLNEGIEHADPMRLAGLEKLQRVRAIKDTGLQREQVRLQRKLGANHPRVTALTAKVNANRDLQRDLDIGVSRARTKAVKGDPNAWTLHGHVRSRSGRGQPNLTVAMYDERNQWIESLGYACTDENGYFRRTVKADGKSPSQDATNVEEGQDAIARAAKETGTSRRGVYIHVTDSVHATLYADATALVPKLGDIVYREIILDGDACECVPPGDKRSGLDRQPGKDKEGRYLGNRRTRELHDLKNTKSGCQLDEIKGEQREYFTNQKEAAAAGYDFCAYCFGKSKSKR